MKSFYLAMTSVMGGLAIMTGSPWYLLPQFVSLACLLFIIGVEIYDAMKRERNRTR